MPTADNQAIRPAPAGGKFGGAGMMVRMEMAMKWVAVSMIVSGFLLLAGCGGPPGTTGASATGSGALPPAAGTAAAANDGAIPPPDARWTIVCTQIKGTGHVEHAKVYKQQIIALTGLKGFYLVHEDDVSTLYFGFYKSIDPRAEESKDSREGKRAQADLAKLRSYENAVGDRIFPIAGMAPLEPADPPAPAEWDLRNVDRNKPDGDPTKAFWSLEIGVYMDSPDRKQGAVNAVRLAREAGVKDVYFFHGKTVSSVCIGAWPQSAVSERMPDRGASDDRPVVMPPGMMDSQNIKEGMRDASGHLVRPVELTYVPVDPTLLDAMAKYPTRAVNGNDIYHPHKLKDGSGTVNLPEPSLVIFIPRDEPGGLLGSSQRDPIIDTGMTPLDTNAGQLGGQLRTIDRGGR